MNGAELARLDAIAQAELVRRKEVTAAELWDACRSRIDALNPLVRALVTVADERPASLTDRPFSGVPFVVKDATPWPGLRWSMGSRLFAKNVAGHAAPLGRKLAEGGLVCIGKSAASEFGLLASTESLLEGATHNPWDLSCSAGGSSGGSAAAVAAGLVPLAHANDGGGSIRIPASACGVFGFKPSRGRTVAASLGSSELERMTSDHCITRSVRDSALFLSVTEDRSHAAPVGFVREALARPLRIATWTRTLSGHEPDDAVLRAHEDAVKLLVSLGHLVEPVAPPPFDGRALGGAFFDIAGATVAQLVASTDQRRTVPVQHDELEPFTWALVERFESRGPTALAEARDVLARAVRIYLETVAGYDVVLTPTVGTASWRIGHLSPLVPDDELLRRTEKIIGYTPLQNASGAPAMSVPLCFPDGGIPIGTHFAAAPGAVALLLGLAYQLEAARPWKDRWPPTSIPSLNDA